MHPAPSVILFTTLSGMGFGLLAFLGLGYPAAEGWTAFALFFIAYALSVGGLLASTFHLGHPERALKAFSQWKTSWLSREGIASVLALLTMAIYAIGVIFMGTEFQLIGVIGAALSLFTVFTTSMIYTQLKTIPRWNMPVTPIMFMTLSITGGALLSGQVRLALVMLILTGIVQLAYWSMGDKAFAKSGTTLASATGLGSMGAVKAFEPPHTGTNYLLRELVYVVGRKHAQKLRVVSFLLMVVLPLALLLMPFNHLFALVAVLSHVAGVAASRWLFFAQAEHVVGLYYGKRE